VDLAPETLSKTNFANISKGDEVNLERALKSTDRNSGHTVQGHVDGVGRIVSIIQDGSSLRFKISTLSMSSKQKEIEYFNSLIVPKGFIAVDGASLTVCDVNRKDNYFTLMMIPHTQKVLKTWNTGDLVNIELDCMAKYVHSTMESFLDTSLLESRVRRVELLLLTGMLIGGLSLLLVRQYR
jgi:riboflavin synthase